MTNNHPDALLYLSFGGPEGPDEVIPFLESVTKGKNIPRARLEAVGAHYHHFGGKSPINDQNRRFLDVLRPALKAAGIDFPVYFANLHSRPFLDDVVRTMESDGIERALCYATSAFGSFSGCRKYRLALERSVEGLGSPIRFSKIRHFYNHPGFIDAVCDGMREALDSFEPSAEGVHVAFTAHSIPVGMSLGGPYVKQLQDACRLVSERVGVDDWDLVYQSRSGPPRVPWLEPDISDHLRALADRGVGRVCVCPIGFVSDHMEVVWDLDTEAKEVAEGLGLEFVRAKTVGTHPRFVQGVVELIEERLDDARPRLALGTLGPSPDVCAADCCPLPRRPAPPARPPGRAGPGATATDGRPGKPTGTA